MMKAYEGGGDRQDLSARNAFTSLTIDRVSRRRRDAGWVAERLEDPTTRLVPVLESKVLITNESPPRPVWLSPEEAREDLRLAESVILLGEGGGHAYFALGLPSGAESSSTVGGPSGIREGIGAFRRLRTVAALLEGDTAALLAYAKATVHYHREHRFCGKCGAPTVSEEGGHVLACTNVECGQHDFPRTDPAVIVLVESGDRCLLGRQAAWPKSLYSIIAGFVEPGESAEAAVAREVWEETGIRVEQIQYHSSQPWPFPRSLMIGFRATSKATAVRLNDGELEDAQWLSREEIERKLRQGTLQLPSPISISHRLIETWFDAEGSVSLKRILEAG